MKRKELKTFRRNDVFRAIEEAGLNPSDFEWQYYEVPFLSEDIPYEYKPEDEQKNLPKIIYIEVPMLIYRYRSYYFIFNLDIPNGGSIEYSPAMNTEKYTINARDTFESWEKVLGIVNYWLELVKRDIEPDLWNLLAEETKLSDAVISDSDNTPFSSEEQKMISEKLLEVKEYIVATKELSEKQLGFINARLGYLEEASNRMGRKDWVNITVSVLFSIIIQVMFSPNEARELFRFAAAALQRVLHTMIPLP